MAQRPQTNWLFQLGFLVTLAAILAGVGLLLWRQSSPGGVKIVLPTATPAPVLSVYVSGAVRLPDVYQLPLGARVADAVEMAGGATDQADLSELNLARRLNDGEHLIIPERGNPLPARTDPQGKVNINTATAGELDAALPGIGPTLAQRIVEYRETHGDFQRPEELMAVSGIGPITYEKLQDLITVY